MTTQAASGRARRISPVMREAEAVTPLELFFDLVFVLAFTAVHGADGLPAGESRSRLRRELHEADAG